MKEWRSPADIALGKARCEAALELALNPMRVAARAMGYAIAVHGSLARDVDLIAIPWEDQPATAEDLHEALVGTLKGVFGSASAHRDTWADKPHGRRAKSIHCYAGGAYIQFDLSVMPTVAKLEEPATD